jgi:hypothetical protein
LRGRLCGGSKHRAQPHSLFWEPIVPLDPSAKRLLDMLAAAGGIADVATMTPQQMRDGFRRLAQAVDIKNVPIGKSEDGARARRCAALPHLPAAATRRPTLAGAGVLPWRRLRLRRHRYP